MNKHLVLAASLTLAGCAGPHYHNPQVSNDQAQRDLAQCRYEAAASTNVSSGDTRRGISGAAGQGVAEGIGQAMRERELLGLCLQARGYTAQTGAAPPVRQIPIGTYGGYWEKDDMIVPDRDMAVLTCSMQNSAHAGVHTCMSGKGYRFMRQ